MKLCPRCNLRETVSDYCVPCQLTVSYVKGAGDKISDEDIIEHHVLRRVSDGCRECGSKTFSYEAGVKYENDLRWFIIVVNCNQCKTTYEEIMEVRAVNESIDNEQ